jgi:hypothetical protein
MNLLIIKIFLETFFFYNMNYQLFTDVKLKLITRLFIKKIMKQLQEGKLIAVLVKIGRSEKNIHWNRSIPEVLHIDSNNYKKFEEHVLGR